MDIDEIRPLFDKHLCPVARQFFIVGVVLGALADFGLDYVVGQDSLECNLIVFLDEGQQA